jgi:hypothetical protein
MTFFNSLKLAATTDEKRLLLSYFQEKTTAEGKVTTVCQVTGMSFTIVEPFLPTFSGISYEGLSPLAQLSAAIQLGKRQYSEAHYNLVPSTLAGAILSILHHWDLRGDHLSAVEANIVLSQLPLLELSSILRFLARLSVHERTRIPHLSLDGMLPEKAKNWIVNARRAIDVTDYTPVYKEPKMVERGILDSSILVETRQEARKLLQSLRADAILPINLQTIITMSIQKNNLAMISDELRSNIVNALVKLATPDCLSLAAIFTDTAKNLTMQERIIKQQFEGSLDSASDNFIDTQVPSKKLTLAEILAKKREQLSTKNNPVKSMIAMMEEVEAEIVAEGEAHTLTASSITKSEEESIEEEFLEDHESLEAIQAASQIKELDMEPDSLLFSEDISDNDAYTNIDVDSLEDGEQTS